MREVKREIDMIIDSGFWSLKFRGNNIVYLFKNDELDIKEI